MELDDPYSLKCEFCGKILCDCGINNQHAIFPKNKIIKQNRILDILMLIIVIFFPVVIKMGYTPYFILLSGFNLLCFIRHLRVGMYLYALQPIATQIMGLVGWFTN